MDQSGRNKLFIQNHLTDIHKELNKGDLSQKLMAELNRDPKNPISDMKSVLQDIEDQSAKNMFILMQFTKERTWTIYLAKVLENLGQTDLANKLTEFNKSEPFRPYNDMDALNVRNRIVDKSGTSMCHKMESKPRGMCLIVLNETELETEAQAFKYVFKQLHFRVQLKRRLSAEQIRELFTKVAKNNTNEKMDALVTVCIGHGQNEYFLGHYFKQNKDDQILISDLIDIFSNSSQANDKTKPKIHLFNCCRVQTNQCSNEINLDKYQQQNWKNNNANTTIIYACSKDIESEYQYVETEREGWSFFGQAFICTLAQYAHDFNFDQILNLTNYRLTIEGNQRYLPQVVKQFCTFNLYFNPGYITKIIQRKRRRIDC